MIKPFQLIIILILGYLVKCPVLFSSEIVPVHVTVRNNEDKTCTASSKTVRILLCENRNSISLITSKKILLKNGERTISVRPGTISISLGSEGITCSAHGKTAGFGSELSLISKDSNQFTFNGINYRGDMRVKILNGKLLLLNELPVEEYLRGVVPLEIGPKSPKDSAAVQAQAVAARTFTYKKMSQRKLLHYDLLPTVADQVYGGASAEFKGSDQAIRATRSIVMTYNGELIEAYYHSTCGGSTAGKHEVWGGKIVPYLISRSDVSDTGVPYCANSPRFEWKETWKLPEFNQIIKQYSKETVGQNTFTGAVSSVIVTGKTESGRIKECTVNGYSESERYGGDKIRFVFRRPVSGNPILYSANFSICRFGNEVIAQGKGYGHGIGMCQMGAIGRARAGQSYRTILNAYYSNVQFEKVN